MSETDRIQYKFMMPAEMKAALEEAAHGNRRSLSAEIIARLSDSLDNREVLELNDQIGQMTESHYTERARLYDVINAQDRTLQQLQLTTRNFTIVAKALGKAFLSDDANREMLLTALARILLELEEDDSSDASEPVPKKPWED